MFQSPVRTGGLLVLVTLLSSGCRETPDHSHLARSSEITPYPGPCTTEYVWQIEDFLANSYTETHTYDESENLITTERDGRLSSEDMLTVYTYDEQNQLLLTESFSQPDGAARQALLYHDNGTVHTKENLSRHDGEVDWTYRSHFTYDLTGNLLEEEFEYGELDSNSGSTRRDPIDGIIDRKISHAYDERGNEILIEQDKNGDGLYDSIVTTTYDEYDNPLIVEKDNDADGTLDSIDTNSYTYDEDGNWLSWKLDSESDGIIDRSGDCVYHENENAVECTFDHNGDGVADSIVSEVYDDEQRIVSTSIYSIEDARIVEHTSYAYNVFGLVRKRVERNGWDETESYSYDPYGNLLKESFRWEEEFGDEPEDHREEYVYSYDCWDQTQS